MRRNRLIIGFFLRLIVLYGLLIAPWPGLDRAYLACFRAAGNTLFGTFHSAGSVRFVEDPHPSVKWPTRMIYRKRGARGEGRGRYDTRQGYLATALAMALIAATPVPWSRRWKALFWGFLLANGFVALRVYLGLLDLYSEADPVALFHFSPFWKRALGLVVRITTVSPEFTFVVPVFIWVIVTLRRRDFERWRDGGARGTPAPGR